MPVFLVSNSVCDVTPVYILLSKQNTGMTSYDECCLPCCIAQTRAGLSWILRSFLNHTIILYFKVLASSDLRFKLFTESTYCWAWKGCDGITSFVISLLLLDLYGFYFETFFFWLEPPPYLSSKFWSFYKNSFLFTPPFSEV